MERQRCLRAFLESEWRTSLYGGYAAVSYNETANSLICNGSLSLAVSTCNMDWSTWWIGSRTQWNITKDFYMGFDTMYSKLHSADFGPIGTLPSSAACQPRLFPKTTSTTGNSASACTAISIPDRGVAT